MADGMQSFAEETKSYIDLQFRARMARFRVAQASPLTVYINDQATAVPARKQKGWTPAVGETGIAFILAQGAPPECFPTE